MTPRKLGTEDAISHADAAKILGINPTSIPRLVRTGELKRQEHQLPSLSRTQVEQYLADQQTAGWITATEAAAILGISKTRTGQIAAKGLLPFDIGPNGRRRYRRGQIEGISRARQVRWHPTETQLV